jgi:hypothetical protein
LIVADHAASAERLGVLGKGLDPAHQVDRLPPVDAPAGALGVEQCADL